jgi:hypothetical protein
MASAVRNPFAFVIEISIPLSHPRGRAAMNKILYSTVIIFSRNIYLLQQLSAAISVSHNSFQPQYLSAAISISRNVCQSQCLSVATAFNRNIYQP